MTAANELNYFLFPHTTLSENHFRNLCVFLPRLSVLEIARQASIPEWAQENFSGWPVLRGGELSTQIGSCVEGYRAFAQVHGGPGGMLGFLSRALDETDEPRYRIQEKLRGSCPPDLDPAQKEIVQAAIFLEIARELDEKELEIASSYAHLNAIEQEFRDILGIEDEESDRAETNLTPALAPDTNGLLYMLPRRIQSWFRMLSLQPLESMPIFVSCFPEVVEEAIEMIRTGCERDRKQFSAATHLLGSIPRLDGLGSKQFRTLIEAPGMPDLLSSCRHCLEDFITSAATGENPDEVQGKGRLLQSAFERFCRKCEAPEVDQVSLNVTLVENASLGYVAGFLGASPGLEEAAWPPVFLSITAV
ncbi:MAG TPA: hypothetical protein HPP81_04800 [Deltaproteobacteria bacterium]|nr:hypothetical protein [Deltaproteobacteria bacterium]